MKLTWKDIFYTEKIKYQMKYPEQMSQLHGMGDT